MRLPDGLVHDPGYGKTRLAKGRRELLSAIHRHAFAVTLCCLAARAAVCAPALDRSAVSFRELPNGLHVIVKRNPAQFLVNVALYVRAGSITEKGYQPGITRFAEALLFEGTPGSPAHRLREDIEAIGGFMGSTTTRDFTFAAVAVAPPHLRTALDTLAKAVGERKFTPQEVQEQRHRLLLELRRINQPQNIELQLERMLWELAYTEHPYRNPVHGTPESLDAITQNMLREYIARFWVPNNMSLLIVGQVEPEQALSAARDAFGSLKRRPLDWKEPPPEPEQTAPRRQIKVLPAERAALKLAFRGPGIKNKHDVCAMDLIYTVLGQGEAGRVRKVLMGKKRLILASDVNFITRRHDGLFIITCVFDLKNELKVREALMAELKRISETPLSDEELAKTKRLLRDAYAMSNETNDDQTGSMGFYDSIDTYEFAFDYIDEVNRITADDILKVAKRYFRPDAYNLLLTKPAEESRVKEARQLQHAQVPG
ncbi:MAG: M16 family metallopeptidase [Armatimonadota bacterium]